MYLSRMTDEAILVRLIRVTGIAKVAVWATVAVAVTMVPTI